MSLVSADGRDATFSRVARLAAAVIAAVGWCGLVLLVAEQASAPHWTVPMALWWNAMFFSDLGNLFAAIVLTGVAAGGRRLATPAAVGQALLALLLIGGMYFGLGGMRAITRLASAPPGDVLIHAVTPPAMLLFWLLLAPHGGLRWRHAFAWALFPLGYFAYALIRGALSGTYPYPWMDPTEQGYAGPLAFALGVAAVFLLVGLTIVWCDRRLARRAAPVAPDSPAP